MSCDAGRVATITINSADHGHVNGRRTRIVGSSGRFLAVPEWPYTFIEWQVDGATHSTANPLVVSSWEDLEFTPVFGDHIIPRSELIAKDQVETEVYFKELHGYSYPDDAPHSYGNSHSSNYVYYTAGPTPSSVSETRTISDGTVIGTFPTSWGYNYGPGTSMNQGTFDGTTSDVATGWTRDPETYTQPDHADGLNLTRVGKKPKNVNFPYRPRGHTSTGNNANEDDYWNYPRMSYRNVPTDGSPGVMYPLMQWHRGWQFQSQEQLDYLDLTGTEGSKYLEFYKHYSSSFPKSKDTYDIDGMSGWRDLRSFYVYDQNSGVSNSASLVNRAGVNSYSPRILDPLNYCCDMQFFQCFSPHGPTENEDNANSNPGWVTQYQDVPTSGEYIHPLRNSLVTYLRPNWYTRMRNVSLTNTYFSNVEHFHSAYPWSNITAGQANDSYMNIDWSDSWKNTTKLKYFYLYGDDTHVRLKNIEFLRDKDNLQYIDLSMQNILSEVTDWTPLRNKKLRYVNPYGVTIEHQDTLYDEPVRVQFDFNSPTAITDYVNGDTTQFLNKLINHGATVTTT